MQAIFKIENYLPAAFMGRGLPFPGVPPKLLTEEVGNKTEQLIEANAKEWPELPSGLTRNTVLGGKFYMPVGFKLEGEVYQLPWEPSLTISTRKTIVKTALAGNTRRGTVKELINADDYSITIQGLCFDHTKKSYPFKDVEKLKKLYEYNGPVEILSALTRTLDITNVVIEDLQLPTVTGRPFSQPFILTLSSDEDFILIQD